MSKEEIKSKSNKLIITVGLFLIILSVVLLSLVLSPAIKEEIRYLSIKNVPVREVSNNSLEKDNAIIPIDPDFSLIIPKIGANSIVINNVDPNNDKEYQIALSKGVAHAKGTPLPEEPGNTFIFAHSSDNFLNANRYNSIFYLLNKLGIDDKFFIYRNGDIQEYKITEKRVIDPNDTKYMKKLKDNKTVTLMTCWPAGTTFKRLVVVGDLIQ